MVRAFGEGMDAGTAEQRLKVPPNSVEAEQSLVGGLMLNKTAWDKVADVVTAEDFYRNDHRIIFSAIASLVDGGNPCDVVTVSEFLDQHGNLDKAGGLEYLRRWPTKRQALQTRAPTQILSVKNQCFGLSSKRAMRYLAAHLVRMVVLPPNLSTKPKVACSKLPKRVHGQKQASNL